MRILILFVLIQAVVILIVVMVLKRKLNQELITAAFEKIQSMPASALTGAIHVRCAKTLSADNEQRLKTILKNKSAPQDAVIVVNPELKEGIVVDINGQVMDFSLTGRLKSIKS